MMFSSLSQETRYNKIKESYKDCQIKESYYDEYDIILNIFDPSNNSHSTCLIHADGHTDWF